MFVTEANPGEAVSAVKAIGKAAASGQRIYHVIRENLETVLPHVNYDASTMSELRAALNEGKDVYTHTDVISAPGWSGAGYVIFDRQSGDGAWKIAGGSNGSFKAVKGGVMMFAGSLTKISTPGWGAIILGIWEIIGKWDHCSGSALVETVIVMMMTLMMTYVASEIIFLVAAATGPLAPAVAIAGFLVLGAFLNDVKKKIDKLCP